MKRALSTLPFCLYGLVACHAMAGSMVVDLDQTLPDARVTLDQVRRGAAQPMQAAHLLPYIFEPAPRPQLTVRSAQGHWDWSGRGELHLEVQNAMAWAVTLEIDIDGAAGQHLHAEVGLPAGPEQTVVVPLQAISPRAQGMQVGPPMPFTDAAGRRLLLATKVEGALELGQVEAIRLSMPSPQAAQTLLLGHVDTAAGDATLREAYAGIIDGWGQYMRGQWPEKVDSDHALRAAQAQAQQQLAGEQVRPGLFDRYGGRMDQPAFNATGWFRTERRDERWQLVTPDGHAFFSLGVNAVNPDGRSYIEGRESMFRGLPPDSGNWAAFYGHGDDRRPDAASRAGIGYNHGRWFDFYAANLYRVDGGDWLAAWRKRALDRLLGWGFNTLGNWSDDALGGAHRIAYTRPISIRGDYGNVSSGYDYWGRMPDPFDPRFAQAAENAVANATRDVRDDPWLLGYFADNELAWAGQGPQGRWGLALGTLRGESRSAAKQAFIAVLKQKYGDPARLAAAWGIPLSSWSALDATGFAAPEPNAAHPAIAEDYSAWLRRYADTYFRTVAEAIRRHDPHHLFLGGRFAVHTPEAVAACAAYCDVLSFNTYTDLPQHGFDVAAAAKLGKPALITEFHFGSDDRGPFGKGVISVWNESQRGGAYARFVTAAAADPEIVGAHWFEYADQPASGRLIDGENSHIGLVGITDLPFGGFVDAVRAVNLEARSPAP